MSYISMIKASCGGNDNTSSKRVTMYHFVYVAIFMVLVQAFFTGILIYKWSKLALNTEGEIPAFEIHSVFPDVIWYCVFGVITGLAGINGYVSRGQKKKEEVIPNEEEVN